MAPALDAPLAFAPMVVAKPWGGRDRLRRFGIAVPDAPPTGEVWLVSDVEGKSSVVDSGPLAGKTLRELVATRGRDLLGALPSSGEPRFPLLLKILEVEGRLSVQVHPDGAQARSHGDGTSGKFEAWAVLDAAPEARVALGFDRRLTRDEVRSLVAKGALGERLNAFAPRPGDAYVISPGTVHAAFGGVLFLEVQETADVTYRLYDWDARGLDGKPRELHVEKALACAELAPRFRGAPPRAPSREIAPGARGQAVVPASEGPFAFEIVALDAGARVPVGGDGKPLVVVGLSGRATLASGSGSSFEVPIGRGVIWPACLGRGELAARESSRIAIATPA